MPDDLALWLDDLVDALDPPPTHLVDTVHALLLIARAIRVA
ncbi:hypothetical protein FHS29_002313 [Saccharothrix tamanrassetensis]|uniref:Uncharacterized protein n=1 Tax=Saccharothrix tamanrassetensis TaxID=1051531 RepID=A0A841CB38_9PSEU|nr:hypothetical protein [Saccharothrix tamanrassetensis]MBB5955732.1 hypothetical protein [Saccharothrix tamanrassetensis]